MLYGKDGKKSIGFPDQEFYVQSFERQFVKKIKCSRSLLDIENSRCGHQQPYKLFSVFANFRTLPDNSGKAKLVEIWTRKINCNREGKCLIISKWKGFRADWKKSLFRYNYWQLYLYHYFGDREDLYISSLFYFSFAIANAKLTCLDDMNRNIYLHFIFVEVTWNILFYELDVLYIFDINGYYCPYEICQFIWFLI